MLGRLELTSVGMRACVVLRASRTVTDRVVMVMTAMLRPGCPRSCPRMCPGNR